MPARGERHVALEPGLVDLDVARCRSDHLVAVDEKGFCSVGADRNLAGDRNDRPVENPAVDFDAGRVLLIEIAAFAKVEEPRFESAFLFRKSAAARRKLQVVDAKLVDGCSALIEQLADRTR